MIVYRDREIKPTDHKYTKGLVGRRPDGKFVTLVPSSGISRDYTTGFNTHTFTLPGEDKLLLAVALTDNRGNSFPAVYVPGYIEQRGERCGAMYFITSQLGFSYPDKVKTVVDKVLDHFTESCNGPFIIA